jgi:hypothetical protein
MEPINYMLDVKNPIEEAMRGYGLGRADIEQRQVMQEREQMMGMRDTAEARAASEFEMRRAEAERQRAQAEAMQTQLAGLRDMAKNGTLTTDALNQFALDNAMTFGDFQTAFQNMEAPRREADTQFGIQLSTSLLGGKPEVALAMLDERIAAAENAGDAQEAAALRANRKLVEIDPQGQGVATLALLTASGALPPSVMDAIIKETGQGGDNKELFELEKQVRKEYTDLTKDYRTVAQAFDRVAASQDTGPGDIALIFNYMKMLDPGSTVREGEFSTAQNSGGIPTAIRNTYNQAVAGERLTAEQRASFKSQAEDLFAAAAKSEERARVSLMPVIKKYGLDENQIFGAPSEAEEEAAPAPGTTPAAADEAKATFMANPAVAALAPEVREMAWEIYQKQTGQ